MKNIVRIHLTLEIFEKLYIADSTFITEFPHILFLQDLLLMDCVFTIHPFLSNYPFFLAQ